MSGAPRITARLVLFDGTAATQSTFTSSPFLVADFETLTLSVTTSDAAGSRMTLQASFDDGLRSAIAAASWSVITTVTVPGAYTVDPGLRWIRGLRSSLDSLGEVIIQAKY